MSPSRSAAAPPPPQPAPGKSASRRRTRQGQLRKVACNKRKKQERAEEYVDCGQSKRILQLAKEQQDEVAGERAAATAIGAAAFLGRTSAARIVQDTGTNPVPQLAKYTEFDEKKYRTQRPVFLLTTLFSYSSLPAVLLAIGISSRDNEP